MDFYKVYLAEYHGQPNHHGIFVETHEDGPGTGFIYHVTGNIQQGMIHEHKKREAFNLDPSFDCSHYLGTVSVQNYPARVREICDAVPAPEKQFNGPRKIDPNKPIRKCQKWCQEAIAALRDAGVLITS